MNIPVVYEDDSLLVVNKPAGLLTIPTPKRETRTLTSILNLFPCHRLDRETSGLIIYAKDKSIEEKMAEFFRQRKVKKVYTAFVQGNLARQSGQINAAIEGKAAQTNYKVIARRKNFSVVELMPETGRTNQLRIHLKKIGHPIVGESKFAFRKDFPLKAKRVMLHAKELEFFHPVTNKILHLSVGLPKDMQDFLSKHN